MLYLWLKVIHLISSTILFGTGLGTAFVMLYAHKTRDYALAAKENHTPLPYKYFQYFKYWFILGWPAFISLIAVFYLMVVKPV